MTDDIAERPAARERAGAGERKRLALISTALTLPAFSSACAPETNIETNRDCVATINPSRFASSE